MKTVADRVLASRKLSPEGRGRRRWTSGLKSTKPRQGGRALLDGVLTPDGVRGSCLKEKLPGAGVARGYRPFDTRTGRLGHAARRFAVIPVLGNFRRARRGDALRRSKYGVTRYRELHPALNDAVEDPMVKAIVLRVDSGGGDGLASDLMYRAVLEGEEAQAGHRVDGRHRRVGRVLSWRWAPRRSSPRPPRSPEASASSS